MTPEHRDHSQPDPATFLSGDAGDVTHPWRRAKRGLGELAYDAIDTLTGTRRSTARLATQRAVADTRALDVLVVGVYRPGSLLPTTLHSLHSERHNVRIALGAIGPAEGAAPATHERASPAAHAGGGHSPDAALARHTVASGLTGGKFQNLNRVLEATGALPAQGQDPGEPAHGPDWVLVVDDDVRLPDAFVDRFVAVCEAYGLDLAQPAQTLRSHSAWKVTRRRPGSLVRETRFVEIGPVTAFSRRAAAELLPFPELRYGWGLDLHWAAVAAERGWRLGVVDALPVRHETGVVAAAYGREEAIAEAARFLADRPYLPSERAGDVLAVHRGRALARPGARAGEAAQGERPGG